MSIATLLLSMLSAFAFCIGNCLRVNNLEISNFPAQHAREEIHVSNFEPEEFYWRDLTQASSNKIEVNPNSIAVQREELNLKYFTRDLNPSEVLKKLAIRTQ